MYDTGMLIGLANRDPLALQHHARILRGVIPLVPGPVVAQVWRAGAAVQFGLNRHLQDCQVITEYSLLDYKRIGIMLGTVTLPPKKRPDVVDALVVLTAAGRGRAAIVTSDGNDISAYAATLPKAVIDVIRV
ncbi:MULTISPECIES: hypothetical protein [unclassified Kitasatospora]|uniref:hypothetical protein n=1 Tax=unclassified Kitasatospora TaxID=2633591 RepID=UPI00070AA459|nr:MULTISPECIES: hypothetical protein [unclassified Kitasatospora]KQV24090.1 hypothetical protein ASC99_02530 [Kitasatospora sp. Root107]KRB67195.1 hypothetical protein ASE03_02210 [Kitasatospora sp. Root187]